MARKSKQAKKNSDASQLNKNKNRKTEKSKIESSKTEGSETEKSKIESNKTEGSETENSKSESSKIESNKIENSKSESNKTENSKTENSKTEGIIKSIVCNTVVFYNIIFFIGMIFMFSFFYSYGKSPIWKNDGLYQHYNAFLYYGEWWRELLKNIFVHHEFSAPVWEWGLGYGSDVITTLSYYVFGDPLALISVMTPKEYGEIGFIISIVFRMYFSGLAFGLYCRKMECKKWSTLLATAMYVFSCYAVYAGVRHPYFISPMIYFPLILLGCEKIFRKESPVPFILAVTVSALSNFYFFYMIVLLTILYVIVRILCDRDKRNIKKLLIYIVKFGICALVGVGISSVLFLPNVMNFFGNTRITGSYKFNFFYPKSQYQELLGSFIGVNYGPDWAMVGMCPIAYLAAGLTIIRRKKEDRWAIWYMLLQIIFLIFPIFGYAFNGFGYVCNRWVFAWVLLIAYLFAKEMPDLLNATKKEKTILGAGCVIYALLCMMFDCSRTEDIMVGCVMLFVSIMFIEWSERIEAGRGKIKISAIRKKQIFTTFLVILFVYHSIFYRYSITEQNYLEDYQDIGTANIKLSSERLKYFKFDEDEFYRIDNSLNDNETANYSLEEGKRTTSFYWSLTCPEVVNFLKENSAYKWIPYSVKGIGNRAWLMSLVSAKYFVTSDTRAALASVPYGYFVSDSTNMIKLINYDNKDYYLYETNNALPFGYTFDKTISKSDFDKMTYTQKQQAMLQGAVVSPKDKEKINLATSETRFSDHNVQTVMVAGDNVEIDGNKFIVKKADASVSIEFTPLDEGEIYLEFKGLEFDSKLQSEFRTEEENEKIGIYDKKMEKARFKNWIPADDTVITASCNDNVSSITYNTDYCKYAEGRKDFLISLGTDSNWRSTVKLKFEKTGVYSFEDISVIYQPMGNLPDYVNRLKEDTLANVEFDCNKITGDISLDEDKLLCFSMPYSKGWKVYVDGKEEKLICANVMFASVMLEAGNHNIELRYCTPYLKLGALISGISIIILIVIIFTWNREDKRNRKGKNKTE